VPSGIFIAFLSAFAGCSFGILRADLVAAQSRVKGLFSSNSAVPLDVHDEVAAAIASEAGHIITADVILVRDDTKTPVLLVGYDSDTAFGGPWKIGDGQPVE
jgi:hypothetical protein